ncbi:hypothetical protein [Virgibacillus sp. DJP39]|uniref:hypothetical protein n=1 Tax=Virgibacillus sp. DJP39 TaxID=3409790 RepID=UPI003BB6D9F4
MRNIVVVLIIILVTSGCGTQTSSNNDRKSQESHHVDQSEKNSAEMLLEVGAPTKVAINELENQNTLQVFKQTDTTKVSEENNTDNFQEEEVFLKLLNEYNYMFDRIKPDVNYDEFNEEHVGYKFKTIRTKEQLFNKFTDIMTVDVAQKTWDVFVKEGENGLYLIPMDLYPMFDKNNPYSIEKINNNTYKLVHEHQSGLHGNFDMIFVFEKFDNTWKITDLAYQYPDKQA